MTQRINYMQQSPEQFEKFVEFTTAARQGAIEACIFDLVVIRDFGLDQAEPSGSFA